MNAPTLVDRVWDYAKETGQEPHDVYVRLLHGINMANPEIIDAAFAELRVLDDRDKAATATASTTASTTAIACGP